MAYVFDLRTVAPIIQGLLTQEPPKDKPIQPMPLLTEQPVISDQPQTEPQEQRSGTDIVNASMDEALKAPNPLQVNFQRGLLKSKQDYLNAKTDAEKQAANSSAEFLRSVAGAAGIDTNGYGSDVSLEDARRNFASQEARAMTEALQGQYSMNPDQYHEKKYFDGIMKGLSHRHAQRLADVRTKDYQAERLAYLDGLLNSYGRDGLLMNEYGNQLLPRIAEENPMYASFYAGIYPNAKDVFTRQNQLEDKDITQRNALEQLGVGHEYDLDRINAQTSGNIALANNNFQNTVRRDEIQHEYGKENAYDQYRFNTWLARDRGRMEKELTKLRGDIERGNAAYLKDYELELQDKKFQQQVAQASAFGDYLGYTGERKKAFLEAFFGIKMPDENTGKFSKASVENGKKLHDMLDADEKNILKQMENELDQQKVAEYQGKLADIRQFKQQVENLLGEQLGVQGGVREFSDDEAANNVTLSYLWSQSNGNMDTFRQYVSNWLDASGITSRFKEQYLENLKAPQ